MRATFVQVGFLFAYLFIWVWFIKNGKNGWKISIFLIRDFIYFIQDILSNTFRIFLREFQAIKNHRSIKSSDWLLFFFVYYLFLFVVVLFPKSAKKSKSEKLLFFLTYFFAVYLLSSKWPIFWLRYKTL